MLNFSVGRMMRLRGIENPYRMLLGFGMAPATARSLLAGEVRQMRGEHFEMLCIALNCTPNDLMVWKPNEGRTPLPETHRLHELAPKPEIDVKKALRTLPPEKLEQILDILQESK